MDKTTCCDKVWIRNARKVSSFHFIFHSILFSVTLEILTSLWAPHPSENLVQIFFPLLAICLHAKNQCDPVIPSADICAQWILQSNWLKALLAITQEQDFPYIWELYSKIDININFYLSTFPAKINDSIFQNKGKNLFRVHFWAYFVVFAQREFFLKHLAKQNCSGPPAFKCQRYRVNLLLNQKLFYHYQHVNIIQSICSIHQIICEIHLI